MRGRVRVYNLLSLSYHTVTRLSQLSRIAHCKPRAMMHHSAIHVFVIALGLASRSDLWHGSIVGDAIPLRCLFGAIKCPKSSLICPR